MRLVVPSFDKVAVGAAVFSSVCMGMIANTTHWLGGEQPLDMATRHFTSLTPDPVVFGVWLFVYARMVTYAFFEISSASSLQSPVSLAAFCASHALHAAWLLAWASQTWYAQVALLQVVAAGAIVASSHDGNSFVEILAGDVAFGAWYAWSCLVAAISVLRALNGSTEDVHDVAVVGFSFVVASAMSSFSLSRRVHTVSTATFGWIVVCWFLRGFEGVAPEAHSVSVACAAVIGVGVLLRVFQ